MKKKLLPAVCGMLLIVFATAQFPQSLNYQAVARNVAGSPILNSSVAVHVSIHDSSAAGAILYSERDTATTNGFGLFSCAVGTGNIISGTFTGINWAVGYKFMEVDLDPTGGSSYVTMGTTQLVSVPYALHARTAYLADTVIHNGAPASVWTTSGNDIYKNNSGNVGIGTSTPGQNLHVYSSLTNVGIAIDGGAAGEARLGLLPGGVDNGELGFRNGLQIGSVSDASLVMTSEWIRVTNTGNVGIGTTSPAAKLDVAGSVKITDGTQGNGKFLVSDANGLASWQTVAVGSNSYANFTHNRFYISTSTGSPYTNITTAGSSVCIISAGAPSNGFIDGFQHNGPDEVVIYNNNATSWTIRPGQSTPSVPFYTGPSAANYVIGSGKSVRIFYEPTTAKWWVLDGN